MTSVPRRPDVGPNGQSVGNSPDPFSPDPKTSTEYVGRLMAYRSALDRQASALLRAEGRIAALAEENAFLTEKVVELTRSNDLEHKEWDQNRDHLAERFQFATQQVVSLADDNARISSIVQVQSEKLLLEDMHARTLEDMLRAKDEEANALSAQLFELEELKTLSTNLHLELVAERGKVSSLEADLRASQQLEASYATQISTLSSTAANACARASEAVSQSEALREQAWQTESMAQALECSISEAKAEAEEGKRAQVATVFALESKIAELMIGSVGIESADSGASGSPARPAQPFPTSPQSSLSPRAQLLFQPDSLRKTVPGLCMSMDSMSTSVLDPAQVQAQAKVQSEHALHAALDRIRILEEEARRAHMAMAEVVSESGAWRDMCTSAQSQCAAQARALEEAALRVDSADEAVHSAQMEMEGLAGAEARARAKEESMGEQMARMQGENDALRARVRELEGAIRDGAAQVSSAVAVVQAQREADARAHEISREAARDELDRVRAELNAIKTAAASAEALYTGMSMSTGMGGRVPALSRTVIGGVGGGAHTLRMAIADLAGPSPPAVTSRARLPVVVHAPHPYTSAPSPTSLILADLRRDLADSRANIVRMAASLHNR